MLKRKRGKTYVLEITDYLVRLGCIEGKRDTITLREYPLGKNLVSQSQIKDEEGFYAFLKEKLADEKLAKVPIMYLAPDNSVLLKTFEHPEGLEGAKLKEYAQLELGNSIHVPFNNAIIDVHDQDPKDKIASIFVVSGDDVKRVNNSLLDLKLNPIAVDLRQLCNYRVAEHIGLVDEEGTYLLANWSLSELSLCIYSKGEVKFLKYHQLPFTANNWQFDGDIECITYNYQGDLNEYLDSMNSQLIELEKVIDFFQFSVSKGEVNIGKIILTGDTPILKSLADSAGSLFTIPVQVVDDEQIKTKFEGFSARHSTLLGLSLKEVK